MHSYKLLLVLFLQTEIYRKYQKRKKELNGIHGLLTDFFIFPGQFFTTNMEYGVWEAANFEKLTFSEILEEDHCTTNNTMQIKIRQNTDLEDDILNWNLLI